MNYRMYETCGLLKAIYELYKCPEDAWFFL